MSGRRADGDGSITYNSAKKTWQASFLFTDKDGRQKRKYLYSRESRDDVSDKLKVALAEQVRGIRPNVDSRSLAAYLAEWLEDDVKVTRSPGTYAAYEYYVRRYINPTIGTLKLTAVGPQDVQKLQNALLNRKLSANTIRGIRGCLNTALNRAVKWEVIPRNPVPLIDPPKADAAEPEVLSLEQGDQLLAATRDPERHALYVVLLASGMRVSECLGLVWRDVNLDTGLLSVRYQLSRGRLQSRGRVELKTRSSRRVIDLPEPAIEALKKQRSRSRQRRLECPVAWPSREPADDYVFSDELGRPWSQNACQTRIKADLKRAGLPTSIHLHSLRHSCGTWLGASGAGQKMIMDQLGHTSERMSLHYTHILPATRHEAAERLARIFPKAANG